MCWQGILMAVAFVEAELLLQTSFSQSDFVSKHKRSLFGESLTPGLIVRIKIVRPVCWQGILMVVFDIEADSTTNYPKLFIHSQIS